jgi:hypothetical protein
MKKISILLTLIITVVGLGSWGTPGSVGRAAAAYASATVATSITSTSTRTASERELFGMVMRDPFYEFNTDRVNFPNATNRTALERQAAELAAAGVRWVRMEFFADYDGSVKAGDINWEKYDWFIKECAPKYGLKVLALLNVGMVAHEGQTVRTLALNDPPDGGGSNPGDGSNHFIRVFTGRAQAIAFRYGSAISAYEIINEPNISWDLWLDSRLGSAEITPERYSALITNAYKGIKNIAPASEVIVGGMLIGSPPEGQDHDQFDYLYQLYVSPWVEKYRTGGHSSNTGWNVVPWDGVALHPYFMESGKLFALMRDFARKLQDRGDFKSKLWVTEVGAEAKPPSGLESEPDQQELNQAHYLREVYTGILNDPALRANVPHVFWFKYEDFVPGNYTHNYGLVRLSETASGKEYNPSGKVRVHKLAYHTYQEIALGYTLTEPLEEQAARDKNLVYFPETQQAIAPEFSAYWLEKGGIERFGYPITRPIMLGGYLSQFFQRAVFEHHPEYAGTPSEVLLRLLGNEYTQGRSFDKGDASNLPGESLYFPETEHRLGGSFRKFWQETGGLAVYGYPISEEISEVSPTNGETYTVQYFERNRFEYHPESAGTPYEVQLGLLGANMLKSNKLWWR